MVDEPLNSGELSSLTHAIETRIKFLIKDSEILLANDGQLQIIAALYIHAIEEFGKLVYVLSIPDEGGIVTINNSNEWFRNHPLKLEFAQAILPPECFVLQQGNYGSADYGRAEYNVHEIPDWQTRLTIFNTDLENGHVPRLPSVDKTDIEEAIKKFKSFLNL